MFQAEANDPTVVSTRHLQHNLAFAKAYRAESLGSDGGLPGNNAYIDSELLIGSDKSEFEEAAELLILGEALKFFRAP